MKASERRALWFSYLDWALLDREDADRFLASAEKALDRIRGFNTVIVHVRPFADSLYPSEIYPWSHLLTGVQGENPGFDPFGIFLEAAHSRGFRVEAWVNPYRIRLNAGLPAGDLSPEHPARRHPEWTRQVGEGLWFDPALPQVRQLVSDGVREIVTRYPVDGVQFDDYFYPTRDPEFDRESYAIYGGRRDLTQWRRENVDLLVRQVYETVKAAAPDVEFGISPQASIDNNLNQQYSNVPLWLSRKGFADYILPQTYWGFSFTHPRYGEKLGFGSLVRQWLTLPRDPAVALYFGLGAYHIGKETDSDREEWSCGHALKDQVEFLRSLGLSGWAVFRFENLWGENAGSLCREERRNLEKILEGQENG